MSVDTVPYRNTSRLSYADLNAYLDARRKVLACPHPDCTARERWTDATSATIAGWSFEDRIVDGQPMRQWFCREHRPDEPKAGAGAIDTVQLCFENEPVAQESVKQRGGCIGKVERFLARRPWATCGDIAKAINEPSFRVSGCLNKLKHEGRVQQRERVGPHGRCAWALIDSVETCATA